MVKDGEPRSIVNVSSTSGIYGNAGQASYALAKAGLVGLTKTVAQEWGPEYGVRANSKRLACATLSSTKADFLFPAVAFGAIKTRLTQAPSGEYAVRPDGTKHAVGFKGGYDEEEKWSVCSEPPIYCRLYLTRIPIGSVISLSDGLELPQTLG